MIDGFYFNYTQEFLLQKWDNEGYPDQELTTVEKGDCGYCLCDSVKVLTQIGVKRFEVNAGACLSCINTLIPENPSLKVGVKFKDSSNFHTIRIDNEKLENFLKSSEVKNLVEEEISTLKESLKKHQINPSLIRSREFQKKPYQCKSCFGYVVDQKLQKKIELATFEKFCEKRDSDNYLVSCFGCSAWIQREGGCSIISCPVSDCSVEMCVFCLNKASDLKGIAHDVQICTKGILEKKIVPKPRPCDCPNQASIEVSSKKEEI